jgi:thioredoxin-like negative regulator of GroEL
MENDTFSNGDVIAYVNRTFVNVELDIEKDRAVAKKFDPTGLPATYLVDVDGRIIGTAIGYINPKDYIEWLGKVRDIADKLKRADAATQADLLFEAGSYREAKQKAEEALKELPELKDRLTLRRVEAQMRLDPDFEPKELLEIESLRDAAVILMADYEARHEKVKEALTRIEEGLKAYPKSTRMDGFLYYRARLTWALTGKTEEPIRWLEQLLKDYPNSSYRPWAQADLKELKH